MAKKLLSSFIALFWMFALGQGIMYGQCPSSVSISANPGTTICAGTEVSFTANPSDGSNLQYQWQINESNVNGATTSTFSTSSLTNGQRVRVLVTSTTEGYTDCSTSSSEATMTVNPNETPTVSLTATPTTKCIGQEVTFTASNTNGGISPTYDYYVNGSSSPDQSSTSNTFSISSLPEGNNTVRVVMTSSLSCTTSPTAETNLDVTITPDATISSPANKDQPVCINQALDPIVFAVGGSGTGASVSGLPSGLSGSFSAGNFTISGNPSVAGNFTYTVTTTGPCGQVSETGTITVNKDATISLTSSNATQDVCQGEAVQDITYEIGETGTGATVSGLPSDIIGSYSGDVFTISGSSNEVGTFSYTIYATGTCGNSESLTGTIVVNQNLDPSVSITSSDSDNTFCEGTEVTFTATPVNGGGNPSYQWLIDGASTGSTSSTFTTTTLTDNQIVSVIMTSDATCLTQTTATSNGITNTVQPNLSPEVSISPSDTDICEGDTITYTAIPVDGGASPSYQWKVDGINVGSNSDTYTTSSLSNGQSVTVILTSDETCLATPTATSDPVTTTVHPNLTPEVSISSNDTDNIICSGSSVTFTATPVNGGTTPTYQWLVNSSPAGGNSESFSTTSLNNGDIVKVVLTSSEECLAFTTAESNEIKVQVDSPITSVTPTFDYPDTSYNSTVVCPVVSGLKYRVQPIAGATSYEWVFPSGWTIDSGNSTNEVRVTATTNAQEGSISVTGINDCGPSQTLTSDPVSTGTVVMVEAGPNQTVCLGTSEITLAGEIGGVIKKHQDWDWSDNGAGGSFSAGGNDLNGIYTLPTSISSNGGTITISIISIDPAGECGPKEDQMTLTVLKDATISDPTNKTQTTCISTAITDISFSITDAGTGASSTGLPPGVNGNYDSGTFTISGTPTESGTFNYTVNTTGSCTSQQTSIGGSITVTPDQTIGDSTNKSQEICINTPIQDIIFSTNTSVSNVSATGLPLGLTTNFSSGSFTISGTPTESGTFNYTVTTTGDCVSTSQSGTITIKSDPTIDSPTNKDQEICINTPLSDITFTTTAPATNAAVEGLPNGITGSYSNGTFTLAGTPTVAGTFDYTVTTISDCAEASISGKIIVKPDPTAQIAYTGEFCTSQTGTAAVELTGTGAFTNGNFYSSPAGLSLDALTGDITPGTSEPGTYTVSYDTASDCATYTAETTVKINQLPSVEISYSGPFCTSDGTAQSVTFTNGIGAFEGGTFSSSPTGLDMDSTTGSITPKTSNPGTYTILYTIPATLGCNEVVAQTEVTITQIPQVSISYDTPLCNSDTTIYGVNYTSTAGDYTGGVFTATAGLDIDAEGNINPQTSTPGKHSITYTKDTDADGCASVEATTQVEIFEKVQITTQPVNYGTCSSSPASFEVVASGDNLAYQWYKKDSSGAFAPLSGETNSILSFTNATSTNAGEYQVIVSSSNGVCSSVTSNTVTLNIDEDIVITKPVEDMTICEDEYQTLTFEYEAHANGAELSFQWIKDGAPISATEGKYVIYTSDPYGTDGVYTGSLTIENIDLYDDGVYAVKIIGPEHFTCSEATSKTFTFRVNPRPANPSTVDVEYCLGATATALTATKSSEDNELLWYSYDSTTAAYTYLGTNITPSTDTPGQTSYWVTQKQPNGCESDPEPLVVNVNDKPEPVATETIEFTYCFNEEVSSALSVSPSEGSTINWYDTVDGTTALETAPIPNTSEVKVTSYWVSQTLTSTGCESDRTKVDVIVNPLPDVQINIADGYAADICLNGTTILVASGATSYVWYHNGVQVGAGAEYTVTGNATGTFTYTVTGKDANECVNTNFIDIFVEEPSEGGTVTGPSSVCVTQNEGTLVLGEYKGAVQRWESSTDGTTWTAIAETSDTLNFQNLSGTTTFRAFVKNGVCDEVPSTEITVSVDPEPVGGELAFDGFGRVIETCSNPGPDYNISLSLTGQVGDVVRWRYKEGAATSWSTVLENGENFTGTTLTPDLIRSLGINQSTIFEVEIGSGACSPNVYSQNATMSIISSDIAPTSVTATPGVLCTGDPVTLSARTGYGTGAGFEEGGAFDFSSITNHGWRIKDADGNESNFDSSADNGVAAIWLRTNPLPLTTAHLTSPYDTYTYSNWDSSAGNEGNKGFAVVSGPNPSTLETSVFNLYAVENPVLTFDQGYNLTPGSAIYVEISTDGGANYETVPLFELVATDSKDGTSGNYDRFGDGDFNTRPKNKMKLDLTNYAGLGNLRIRFRYEGTRPGDVWAVDAISLPVEATNVDMVWTDYTDPNNPVVIGNNNSEQWTPSLIGWNDFEIRTKLVFDSTGQQCPVVENFSTIKVFVFDQYMSTATAATGSCGNSDVPLNGVVVNSTSSEVTEFPTRDGYSARWEVVSGPDGYAYSDTHFVSGGESTVPAINDPKAVFSPGTAGSFTLRWAVSRTADDGLKNESCPPVHNDITFEIIDCTALDFDGTDDYVDIGEGYTGDYSIEAWIRPEATTGTIISTPQLEINMQDLPAGVTANGRWYHIAVDSNGKLYIDGIDAGKNITKTGTARAFIGARWNEPNVENHFSGWIEEVRIWNGMIEQDQIKFLMNQRLQNFGNIGVEIPMPAPGLPYSSLEGYYQLLANNILNGGYTPDLASAATDGKLRNMETLQENTAPLPYTTSADGKWTDENATWTHWNVWDIPHANGINGTPITWNIVRTSNYIESGNKDITVLGLIVESNELDILNPSGAHDETNSGQRLEVTHYLKIDGVLDLTGESQLLQPMGSVLEAVSSGYLERDQQGKRLSFNYNYWSSPVSAQGAANNADYSVSQVLLDGTNSATPQGIMFKDEYHAADKTRTTPITVSNYWIWKFLGTADKYEEWFHIGSTGTLATGEGFTMKGTDGTVGINDQQNYVFRGKPHNGSLTRTVSQNQNYLVGNPYASAIDATEFILDNMKDVTYDGESGRNSANIFNGALYYWDHFSGSTHYLQQYIGGYATWTLAGGVQAISNDERILANEDTGDKIPGMYIPVAQGFFVNTVLDEAIAEATGTTVSGGSIEFKNSQRIYQRENGNAESIFHSQEKKDPKGTTSNRNAEDSRQKIWLKFSSPMGYHRQLLVTADPNTTSGFDLGYDAPLIEDNAEDMYWYFNNYEFVIQAVEDFNVDRELQLGMKVHEEGKIIISIDELKNIPDDTEIFLKDSLMQVNHDLRKTAYRATSDTGTFHNRFKLIFKDPTTVVVEEPEVPEAGEFEILYVNGSREILVKNPQLLNIERIYLNNMLGQQLHVYYDIPAEKEIRLPVKRFSSGVYIVKVHSEKGIRTKKVILE